LIDQYEVEVNLFDSKCGSNLDCLRIISPIKGYITGTAEGVLEYLQERGESRISLAVIDLSNLRYPNHYFESTFSSKRRNEIRKVTLSGFQNQRLTAADFNTRKHDVYQIHKSKSVRQGEMKSSYLEFPEDEPILSCDYHNYLYYGSFSGDNNMAGYIKMAICGDIADCIALFGHGFYMQKYDIMRSLWTFMVVDLIQNFRRISLVSYDLPDAGGDGLRTWKESVGLRPVYLRLVVPSSLNDNSVRKG